MARTQAADYEQRREAIVNEAAKLYATHGFLGASLADLALACNTSKSLIYHYYGSKEDILFDIMASHIDALKKAAEKARAGPGSAADRLRAVAHAFMGLYVGAAARHKVLLNELENLPTSRQAEIVAGQRRIVQIVERLFTEIEPKLKDRSGALRPTVMLFFGMINWTYVWFDPRGAASAADIADMAVDMALHGIAPKS